MSRPFATTKACFILFFGVGCGGPPAVATRPVSGKVTVDGRPATSGQVSFAAADDKVGAGLCTGIIGVDGEYKISSDGKLGAPPGKYKVTVTPSMTRTGGDFPSPPFNARYMSSKSTPLVIEVVNKPVSGAYDLKLKK
jgi:hypothetical protein